MESEEKVQDPKRAVFYTLINKGTPAQPRWMISDQWDRVWNEAKESFVKDHTLGTLYDSFAKAAWDMHDMLVDEYKNKPTFEYEAPIKMKIYSDKPIDEKIVADWCRRACRFLMDSHSCGLGPLDNTFGLLVADWNSLKRKEEVE